MSKSLTKLLLAVVIGTIVLVVYGVWYGTVSSKSAQVADLENQIVAASNSVADLTSARATLSQVTGDEAAIQHYFVAESDVVPFINGLQALGAQAGATTTVLSVSTATVSGKSILQLALSLEGTFDAVMRTIGAIEYAPYDLMIASLSVKQAASGDWTGTLNITVGSIAATSTPSKS